ncbi:TRM11 family SAM-dependent methyltransferase [Brachybacterium hainanense]|uniref:TRM11 family SAM-dependent methyltransferase n=1 Tax=Brachybacterium hainanense TaxID=1541174 RepID=A0ABV6RI06_9MICO
MSTTLLALRAPSANRVYTDAAGPLAAAEARWVLGTRFPGAVVHERLLAGHDHLEITADAPREQLLPVVSLLSSTMALYEPVDVPDEPAPLLRPVPLAPVLHHSSDLETTLKYPGKTNEQFTALLINLAASLSENRDRLLDGTLALLDPMCGRGTTLNRALRLGLSPTGADLDRRDTDAYRTFLLAWLRQHRLRHTSEAGRLSLRGASIGTRFRAELAADKETLRAGGGQSVTVLGTDTLALGDLLPDGRTDAIVADLPYGVQHGAHHGASLQRSPLEVLRAAAPVWRRLMRPGAGMALAVNRRTADHAEASALLADAGLQLLSADGAFRHRVDQAIDRDVLLVIRSDHPRADMLRALGAPDPKDSHV